MVDGGHGHPCFLHPLPVLLGDPIVGVNEPLGGDAAQADDHLGAQQGHLVAQIADTGVLLGVQGVPVVGRAALDNIGDVYVFLPAQINEGEHIVQQLACGAHKGLPLQVLLFSRALPHQQNGGGLGPHPEHHVVSGLRQGALAAGLAGVLQLFPG